MALKADADLTDPPALSLDFDTLVNWGGYVLIAGVAFAALSVAQQTVQPAAEGFMGMIPGVRTGEAASQDPWGW